jgi:hypothetical protein
MSTQPPTPPTPPGGPFALDLRSLAVMRVGVGVLVVADILVRAANFAAHYGDHGVIPRTALVERFMNSWQVCLHAGVGTQAQMLLFAIAAIAGVMLCLGYRTRTATVVSWVLLCSLHTRNYMVLQAGDVGLRMVLFWAMFLPLGARWSLDARLRDDAPPTPTIRTVATLALVAQIVFIYAAATISKMTHPVWWRDGLGVYYALNAEEFTTPLGFWLLQFPGVLVVLNYLTLVIQASVPVLLLSPWRTKQLQLLAVVILVPMHITFALMLDIGLFSHIVCTLWLVMLPTVFWDRVEVVWHDKIAPRLPARAERAPRAWPRPIAAWIDHERRRANARPNPVLSVGTSVAARAFVGAAVIYSAWWNMKTAPPLAMSRTAEIPGRVLRFEQRWFMFSNPPKGFNWYITPAERADGSIVDIRSGDAVDWRKPELVSASFDGQRWRKYMVNLDINRYRRHRDYFLRYWCRTYNAAHPRAPVVKASLFKMEQATPLPGHAWLAPKKVEMASIECPR